MASSFRVGSLQTTLSEVVVVVLVEVVLVVGGGVVEVLFVVLFVGFAVLLVVVVVGFRQSAFVRNFGFSPNFTQFVDVGGLKMSPCGEGGKLWVDDVTLQYEGGKLCRSKLSYIKNAGRRRS